MKKLLTEENKNTHIHKSSEIFSIIDLPKFSSKVFTVAPKNQN